MRIGQLDKRVRIQRPISSTSAAGASTIDFEDVPGAGTVWARVEALPGGAEIDEANRLQPKTFWKVTIRRRVGINRGFRFLYGDRAMYIRDFGDDDRRSPTIEFMCTEYPP